MAFMFFQQILLPGSRVGADAMLIPACKYVLSIQDGNFYISSFIIFHPLQCQHLLCSVHLHNNVFRDVNLYYSICQPPGSRYRSLWTLRVTF